jgi:nicotinamidase/pyrazinamidase
VVGPIPPDRTAEGKYDMPTEKPAFLIIDMVKDYFDPDHPIPVTPFARKLIEPINRLSRQFRQNGWPVVFATDAFQPDDFFFGGRMTPHSIIGTPGAEVVDDLIRTDTDYWLPKPKLSAFFQTGLETWLRDRAVTLCAVAGITTNFCVLTTVMDALCHDFKAILLEDCTAAVSDAIHQVILDSYRKNALYPLLKVQKSIELASEWGLK